MKQQLLYHMCSHLRCFLYSSCLHGSSHLYVTWPHGPREIFWCSQVLSSEGKSAGAQTHWGKESRDKPCPSQAYRKSAPGKLWMRIKFLSSGLVLSPWFELKFEIRSKVKQSATVCAWSGDDQAPRPAFSGWRCTAFPTVHNCPPHQMLPCKPESSPGLH